MPCRIGCATLSPSSCFRQESLSSAVLLGHQSVRVTERHYNPWVRSRQEQLEADVANAWKLDPALNDKNLGTNQVHFEKGRVN